jgi:tRNA1(Val) A37 N6-methylase TrmN6
MLSEFASVDPSITPNLCHMSTPAQAAFAFATGISPAPAVSHPARITPKIVRTPVFSRRARPINLAAILRPIIEAAPRIPASAWVLGIAGHILNRTASAAPARWLSKLAASFDQPETPLPTDIFDALPSAVWNESALLGEVLCAARAIENAPRQGRAGRVSIGSVYTPTAVARAIVGEVHVGARRVLDPSCGAGAFLLEAFQRAYHRRIENGAAPAKAAEDALQHELAGIDIDAQALAVAEFSLRTLAYKLSGLERDIAIDLRCADALQAQSDLENQCECIVGNPPFVEGRGLSDSELASFREKFRCAATGKINLFAIFIERSLSLLKDGGVMALVLPATFQRNARYLALREVLLEHTIESIKPLDPEVFGSHVVETVVLRVRKAPPQKTSRVMLSDGPTLQSRLPMGPVLRFIDHLPQKLRRQIEVMERHGVPLEEQFVVRDGISTGFQPFPLRLLGKREGKTFVAGEGTRVKFDPLIHKKVIDGSEFNSFMPIAWAGRYIEYDKRHEHHPPHPGKPFNCQLRDSQIYDRGEKLLTRQTARGLIATVDRERYFVRNSVHVTYAKDVSATSLVALCACLNSKLYCDYLLAVTGENGSVFPQVHIADVKRLPILPGLLKPGSALCDMGELLLQLHTEKKPDADRIGHMKDTVERFLRDAFGF